MRQKIAFIALGLLPGILFLILKYKGIMLVPPVMYPNETKNIHHFIPLSIVCALFSFTIAFSDQIKKMFKTQNIASPRFFEFWWMLIALAIPLSLSLAYTLIYHRYHENIFMLILPILLMFQGNYSQLNPPNSFDIFSNKYLRSDEIIWRKVFRLRGRFLFFYGIFLMPINLNDRNFIWTFTLHILLVIITWGISYFYARKLYYNLKHQES